MVVSKKPVFELAPLAYFVKELCQGVPPVKPAAEYVLHTGGTTVGDDVVHLLLYRLSHGRKAIRLNRKEGGVA